MQDAISKTGQSGWNLSVIYSKSESALARRAEKIARERGWPLPVARSEAEAEWSPGRAGGQSAKVVTIPVSTTGRE